MLMSLTNYGEALALEHLLDNTARRWLALFVGSPGESGGGLEVTGGGYGRAAVTWGPVATGSPSSRANASIVTFPTATAHWAADPERITDWAVFDAIVGGNMIWYGKIKDVSGVTDTSREILAGDTVTFPAGALVCQMD